MGIQRLRSHFLAGVFRFGFSGGGFNRAASRSAASLASRSARSRCVFLSIAAALAACSAIASLPSARSRFLLSLGVSTLGSTTLVFANDFSFRVTTGKWLSSYDNYAILTIDVLSDGHPAVVHQDSLGQSTRRRSLAGMHRHAMTRWLGHPACRRFRNNIGAQTRPRSDNLVRQAARYVAPR